MSLAEFQDAMCLSLRDSNAPCPEQVIQRSVDRQSRRFNIYRNNRAVSLIDNLQAVYPTVSQLVGDEFFRAAAGQYIRDEPPRSPCMAEYGGTFGKFLAEIPTTAKIPWIADVAALDWARLCAYHAADAATLDAEVLATFTPEELDVLYLVVHPSVFIVSSNWPVGSIWQSVNHSEKSNSVDMTSSESILVVRPRLDVSVHVLPADGVSLLQQLQQGYALVAAVSSVTDCYPSFNPGSHLHGLFNLGVFTSVNSGESFDQRN